MTRCWQVHGVGKFGDERSTYIHLNMLRNGKVPVALRRILYKHREECSHISYRMNPVTSIGANLCMSQVFNYCIIDTILNGPPGFLNYRYALMRIPLFKAFAHSKQEVRDIVEHNGIRQDHCVPRITSSDD